MTISEMFKGLISNIAVDNAEQISLRYGEITASLNKKFRGIDSKTANTIQVGSYGRWTGVKGISDLDMLYIMPKSMWNTYKDNKQLKLLQDVKKVIDARYPATTSKVDRQVVVVTFQNFEVEVLPAFEQDDGSFKFPNTYGDGKWEITKPREEIKAISDANANKNSNLRRLCKMTRAWKNKHGVSMGGLLIDTLAHNFLNSTEEYDDKSFLYYDWMNRDFFKYLSELPHQDYYAAPGSGQRVYVKKKFQRKAKKAYNLSLKAIKAGEKKSAHDKWKKVFGRPFPAKPVEKFDAVATESKALWNNTEQFIEDQFNVDIRYHMKIDCEVTQDGFLTKTLREMLVKNTPLKAKKRLTFKVVELDAPPNSSQIYWKVLNRGEVAQQRDCIRGQIVSDEGFLKKKETTDFRGEHIVECYAVKNGVVIAKDRINVPIQ